MRLDQFSHDCEADAKTAPVASQCARILHEQIEDIGQSVCRDADAVVADTMAMLTRRFADIEAHLLKLALPEGTAIRLAGVLAGLRSDLQGTSRGDAAAAR